MKTILIFTVIIFTFNSCVSFESKSDTDQKIVDNLTNAYSKAIESNNALIGAVTMVQACTSLAIAGKKDSAEFYLEKYKKYMDEATEFRKEAGKFFNEACDLANQ